MSWRSTWKFLAQHPLTSKHRGAAVARVLKWQVRSRLNPGGVVMPFIGEARLLVRRGMTGATGNLYAGLHEFEDMALLLHALRPSDLFVDVGANVGSYTILAAKVAGAHCVTVEPVLTTYHALADNVRLNGVEARVELVQQALGREPGQVRITTSQDTMNHIAAAGALEGTECVNMTTLDTLLAGRSATLIKIDVEGFEFDVLAGAVCTLKDPSLLAIILETNDASAQYDLSNTPCHEVLTSNGFQPLCYSPRTRQLRGREPFSPGANTLYVRDRQGLEQRLKDAATFRVLKQEF